MGSVLSIAADNILCLVMPPIRFLLLKMLVSPRSLTHLPTSRVGLVLFLDKICQVNKTTPCQSRNANPYAAATPLVKNIKFVLTKNAIPRGDIFTPEDLVKLNYFTLPNPNAYIYFRILLHRDYRNSKLVK